MKRFPGIHVRIGKRPNRDQPQTGCPQRDLQGQEPGLQKGGQFVSGRNKLLKEWTDDI